MLLSLSRPERSRYIGLLTLVMLLSAASAHAQPTQGGPLPTPLPLFPGSNWWNLDITSAPLDVNSVAYINHIGGTTSLHPDFGGVEDPSDPTNPNIYGMPYVVVDGTQAKLPVHFDSWDESDGVDLTTHEGTPFYPIPEQAKTQTHWIEGGPAGNVPPDGDRHMLIVDRTNNTLYELYHLWWDGTRWTAGSGAFFDMKTNNRRPDGWTSADAAGLAILPGLLRYDEVYTSTAEIGHAFRLTVQDSNGYVYPGSHNAGSTAGALPMGARLRLKQSKDISSFTADMQKIFRAMKAYGLIVADNGSNMYIGGTFDTRWDNDVLNPAFGALRASDFEVVQLAYSATPTATATASGRTTPTATATPRPTSTVTPTTATSTATATARPTSTATATARPSATSTASPRATATLTPTVPRATATSTSTATASPTATSPGPTPTRTASGATSFFTLAPCRVLDTRGTAGPYGAPALPGGGDRVFRLNGQCGIPSAAKAISVNLTVTQPSAVGDLQLFASGSTLPNVAEVTYVKNQTLANNAIVRVSALGDVSVHCDQPVGSTVHFILDVNGYFQ
jgi:hypothetical protein